MKERIEFKELIELFVLFCVPDIKCENEIPNFNIVFDKDGFDLINSVRKCPFKKEGSWTPSISKEDMDVLNIENNSNNELYTLYINDSFKFFLLLNTLVNAYIDKCYIFNHPVTSRNICMQLLKRIWLRMSSDDFNDPYTFLEREISFLKDNTFNDIMEDTLINNYMGINVYGRKEINHTWDETTYSMYFSMKDENSIHELSHVLYGIDGDTCYIYGVQNQIDNKRDKSIERKLYKLEYLYRDYGVHPNQLYTLISFICLIKNRGIKYIKVPKEQVLNYRYHQLLSIREKERFLSKWNSELIKQIYSDNSRENIRLREEYEYEHKWYINTVDKEDLIKELKTTKLFNLISCVIEGMNIEIIDEDKEYISLRLIM